MTRMLGLSGSLRAGSFNTALLRAAAGQMPAGASLEVATLLGIPRYDGDAEARDGTPAAVTALKQRIIHSDALLIETPEYNNSMPGVLTGRLHWQASMKALSGRRAR